MHAYAGLVEDGACRARIFAQIVEEFDRTSRMLERVYRGPLAARRYSGFGMGLAESEGPDLMAGVHALDGEAALKHFLALQPSFDINA